MTAAARSKRGHAEQIANWIEQRHPAAISAGSTIAILVLGVIDYLTGPEIASAVFYLLPLSASAWGVGVRRSLMLCALAAATWLVADAAAGQTYSNEFVPIWNTATRLSLFLLLTILLSSLRDSLSEHRRLARTDPLTGVANPRHFEEAAILAIATASETRQPFSLAYIDLDDFKKINDTLGHSGGDEVLRLVASALNRATRGSDTVGRLGGDEFALILPRTGVSASQRLMDDLTNRISHALSELEMPVTFSAGAVTFLIPPVGIDEMIKVADALMYEAKRGGKGTFRHVTVGEEAPHRSAPEAPPGKPVGSGG